MFRVVVALALSTLLAAPALARQAPAGEASDRIVNDPRPETFRPYGFPLPPLVRKDPKVQFGKALRLVIPRAEREDGRLGLTLPILKPIKAGDRVVVAFWARAEKTEGGAPGRIARVQLEIAKPPHRAIFLEPVEVGPEWRMHQVSGTADGDYVREQLNVAMHLAGARQTIEVGPVFVLRYPKQGGD